MKLPEVLQAYKTLFGLNHLTLALGYGRKLDEPIRTVAVCAGSGSSVLNSNTVAQLADLFVTGEMSHHDRLDAVSRGISLIIAGHSNTERGFLATRLVPELQNLLTDELSSGDPGTSSVQVFMSKVDTEPGTIV
ncbi:putative GTP cyclohydrolase 1 type 2 Nif3l1 [Fasciola hepatica]|uniref:NIF3-like protein 1 n=1 Tax=Fasciola hepatica TaxID=6192 RepID=A0A4E0S166_FASHE|nr:putative GTP cyclohydrolase 1 type 2 Nif3l1 [Fasciola hepatica]